MSTVTDTQAAARGAGKAPDRQDVLRRFSPPTMRRLIAVELRKAADTRSGRWLLIAAVAISLILGLVRAFTGDMADRTLAGALELTVVPLGILLPVMGILLVTSEWSQRTALATFALVPERQRVIQSKVGAALLLGLAAFAISLVAAVLGNLVTVVATNGDGSWSLSGARIYQAFLFQELSLMIGLGFGLLFRSSPVAIVAYFALPTVFAVLGGMIKSLESTWEWLDTGMAFDPLSSGAASGDDWGKILVSSLLWIVLPLAVGTVRLLRSEIK